MSAENNENSNATKKPTTYLRPPAESFVTMTDVMNSINRSLQSLNQEGEEPQPQACFELQRRLPDGSTRKASPSEQDAADCQTRMQQASQWLASLTTKEERFEWAEVQRLYGNQLYQQQQYENAINVYLTCLPAVVPTFASGNDTVEQGEAGDDEDARQHRLLLYCQIMNNLAQSALQLQWYRKAETFCTMALEYYYDSQQYTTAAIGNACQEQMIAKLYFRRGKARRYRGDNYQQAKADFERALELSSSALERRVIQNELRQLYQKARQSKRNQQQQKEALQSAMMAKSNHHQFSAKKEGLFSQPKSPPVPVRKAYSTLRAPRAVDVEHIIKDAEEKNVHSPLISYYWEYYWTVVGRVAIMLLLQIVGDDSNETKNGTPHPARTKPLDQKLD